MQGAARIRYRGPGTTRTQSTCGRIVTENANEGTDLVNASISYVLVPNIENLTLLKWCRHDCERNSLDNVLNGSINTSDKRSTGGAGNDTYIVGAGDSVVENAKR